MNEKIAYSFERTFGAFAKCEGMEYGSWIGSRGGHSAGDLINHPSGVIESLIRDYANSERDLQADADFISTTDFNLPDAKYNIDDYYNQCLAHNLDEDWVERVEDYVGATKTFTLASSKTVNTGDRIVLTNINSGRIDTSSFDDVETARSGWIFGRVITDKVGIKDLISEACFESHTILVPTDNDYRLIALDTGSSVGTLGRPLHKNGKPMLSASLTPTSALYNKFVLKYAFDYARSEYLGEVFCNKNGSSNSTALGSTYKTLCGNVESNYKTHQTYEKELNWIYDQSTAEYLAQKLIYWHTAQRLRVNGSYQISDAIQYEMGDLVKINYSEVIPTSKNNSAIFMITGKHINLQKGSGYVTFNLTEMI